MATSSTVGVVGWMMIILLLLLGTVPGFAQDHDCVLKVQGCVGRGFQFPTTRSEFRIFCTAYVNSLRCMDNLDRTCRHEEYARLAKRSLEFLKSYCESISAKGQCTDAIDCFFPTLKTDFQPTCSSMTTMLNCVNQKSGSNTCRIDESKISFAEVLSLTSNLCGNKVCTLADQCMKDPGLPQLHSVDLSKLYDLPLITATFTSPGFFCRTLENVAGCYADHGEDCGLSSNYIAGVKAKHERLKKQCPPDPNGGDRVVPGRVCGALTVLMAALLGTILF
ncbi:uncharacterized protein LOC143301470 [Babylonia areolata]|uniref:uncharacterized protein LOC143301470 n=1 Tax=Babylonia areolata TaxID=304850 RepID=UPI003FD45A9E